jgi:hypothetical protein
MENGKETELGHFNSIKKDNFFYVACKTWIHTVPVHSNSNTLNKSHTASTFGSFPTDLLYLIEQPCIEEFFRVTLPNPWAGFAELWVWKGFIEAELKLSFYQTKKTFFRETLGIYCSSAPSNSTILNESHKSSPFPPLFGSSGKEYSVPLSEFRRVPPFEFPCLDTQLTVSGLAIEYIF